MDELRDELRHKKKHKKKIYDSILGMHSVWKETAGEYPSREVFYECIENCQVIGDEKRGYVVITPDPKKSWIFKNI